MTLGITSFPRLLHRCYEQMHLATHEQDNTLISGSKVVAQVALNAVFPVFGSGIFMNGNTLYHSYQALRDFLSLAREVCLEKESTEKKQKLFNLGYSLFNTTLSIAENTLVREIPHGIITWEAGAFAFGTALTVNHVVETKNSKKRKREEESTAPKSRPKVEEQIFSKTNPEPPTQQTQEIPQIQQATKNVLPSSLKPPSAMSSSIPPSPPSSATPTSIPTAISTSVVVNPENSMQQVVQPDNPSQALTAKAPTSSSTSTISNPKIPAGQMIAQENTLNEKGSTTAETITAQMQQATKPPAAESTTTTTTSDSQKEPPYENVYKRNRREIRRIVSGKRRVRETTGKENQVPNLLSRV